jgi:hypothetical protein
MDGSINIDTRNNNHQNLFSDSKNVYSRHDTLGSQETTKKANSHHIKEQNRQQNSSFDSSNHKV